MNSIKSFPERLVEKLPLPFWLSWLFFWFFIFAVDLFFSFGSPGHSHLTELGVNLFSASVCISVGLSARILANLYPDLALFVSADANEMENWYAEKMSWIFHGYRPIIAGILFASLVELTVGSLINSFNQSNEFLLYFRMTYRLIGFFFLGLSIWSLANVLLLPSQLLRFKFKPRLSSLSGIGLQALGSAFLKMSLITIVCFIFLVFNILVSPLNDNVVILIWVGVGTVLIFCFFLLPQLGIHRIMALEKRQQLVSFSNHLEDALSKSMINPSAENMQRLKEMFELQSYLKSLNDWPFNVSAFWQLVSALLIPLLLVVLQIIFRV
ncbi:MAG: hypothetical protein JSU09_00300 [Bacteroidetes bacterium]|nr:hypothetical protein [Bacteroidota bacterium]